MHCALHFVAIDLLLDRLLVVFNVFHWIIQVMLILENTENENRKAAIITQLDDSSCQCWGSTGATMGIGWNLLEGHTFQGCGKIRFTWQKSELEAVP